MRYSRKTKRKSNKPSPVKGFGRDVPPTLTQVIIYFLEKNIPERQARFFFQCYANNNWSNRNSELISNWKVEAWKWILNFLMNEKDPPV